MQTKYISLSPGSPQDENKRGKEGEGWSEADRGTEEEEGAEAGGAEEERPEETDLVHQEWGELPVFPAGQPRVQLSHHGPQSGPAAAADVYSQVGQEEQRAEVCHQVHEVPPVSDLSHRLPMTLPLTAAFTWTPPQFKTCYYFITNTFKRGQTFIFAALNANQAGRVVLILISFE